MKALAILCLLSSAALAETDRHTTATAAFGLVYMQIDRIGTSGMLVQPTVTHARGRFELQAGYALADLRDDSARMAGSILHRLGLGARYAVQHWPVGRDEGGADIVVELGLGLEYLERDVGDAFGRADFNIGVGGRFLFDVNRGGRKSAFMGIDTMFRGIVTPSGDKAFLFTFGVPFGR
jgi:hypothetical protein